MASLSATLSLLLSSVPPHRLSRRSHSFRSSSSSSNAKQLSVPILDFKPLLAFPFPLKPTAASPSSPFTPRGLSLKRVRVCAVAEEAAVASSPSSEGAAARRLYIGNIPRDVDNAQLAQIVEEHGAVEAAEVMYDKYSGRSRRFAFVTMKTVEDANAVVEKLNGSQIGGREIKVNITEKPLSSVDLSPFQAEESQFVDSPHKVYVGNLSKSVTTDTLKQFFSEKGQVLSAKVSRVPGTSKSSGFGFVTFSSDEDVEAAIASFNNALMEGQRIRVNKA
ncbi:30S ribosomal protein 2, chloroplastic [Syzygium oleosum]|uniref:30S ribosomal protein 2, chloroplastic n=1 Tax=Syzygium oleosum TaxID=219896 RepID=UPI0011D28005|nr:30S ribosomal protein 2, chloroplastic [Syzygium oleosum]XP_056169175.1 30S ribosomal protein 2, chloroplastic [Syzygium oleosum]